MKPKMTLKICVDIAMTVGLMLLKNEFVFFDFAEPLVFFFLDYLAVMGLFVFLGHYCSIYLKWFDRKRKKA